MSSHYSVPAEVQAILKSSVGGTPVRPNSPVLPLESPYATASFIDPSATVIQGKRGGGRPEGLYRALCNPRRDERLHQDWLKFDGPG